MISKKSQEEMVGFGIIIAIVAIILLVFLWFALTGGENENLNDYKAESFLKSSLQYTSECEGVRGFFDISDLAYECDQGRACLNNVTSCEVLEKNLEEMLEEAWKGDGTVKGYELNITSDGQEVFSVSGGNKTRSSRGAREELSKAGAIMEFVFKIYN